MLESIEAAIQGVWRWFGTEFGISTFFFLLDVGVVVLLLPQVLEWRARRRWRLTARTLLYDTLTTIEILEAAANAISSHLYRDLKDFPKTEPSAPPDAVMLGKLREDCMSTRGVIDTYKSNFGLAHGALDCFPKYLDLLTAFGRSLIELETRLRIMEKTSDWGYLWQAWKLMQDEVNTKFPKYRPRIQRAIQSRFMQKAA